MREIITTHLNADFDALASMVAAKKLFPRAVLVLPGSQEKKVREFLSLSKDLLEIKTEKECDLKNVKRLIIVETRHASRLGSLAKILEKEDVEIYIYDHHPRTELDIKANVDIYKKLGATVTILAEIIKRRRIKLTPLEATIMALGIYEDTGSLTFQTTTKMDVDIVSFLLNHGANLNVVSAFLRQELSPEELTLLSKLLDSTRIHTIKGLNIAFSSCVAERYVGELALLTHRLMDVENFDCIFVMAKIDSKIQVSARSRSPYIDVGATAAALGGGGHATASSAMVREKDLEILKAKIIRLLSRRIKVSIFAKDIMTRPQAVLLPTSTLHHAKGLMDKEKANGLPVFENRKLIGIFTEDKLEHMIAQGHGNSKVKIYLPKKLLTVDPDTPLSTIKKLMFEEKKGVIPVVKKGKFLGLVTRTAVLETLDEHFVKEFKPRILVSPEVAPKIISVEGMMKRSLPAEVMNILKWVGNEADKFGYDVYVVGGFVRDLLLGASNFDFDIVVEKDAIAFGRHLAEKTGGAFIEHRKFGTATVVRPDRIKIDLATARTEYYEKPAALPTVKFSNIKDDLYRRDFTINAMAIKINRKDFGKLIDFFGGLKDLQKKSIRILHNLSFVDDPTRIFRAVRFEQRLNFKIDRRTEQLIKTAVNLEMFEKTSVERLRDEIILILNEPQPIKAIKRMFQLHELRFIHPKLKLTNNAIDKLKKVKNICNWYTGKFKKIRPLQQWLMYFIMVLDDLEYDQAYQLGIKFKLKRSDLKRLLSYKAQARKLIKFLNSKSQKDPSQIYKRFEPLSFEVILLAIAKSKRIDLAKEKFIKFLEKSGKTALKITGEDLSRLGLKAGPKFGKILDEILYAKLDGKVRTKKDELELAKRLIK